MTKKIMRNVSLWTGLIKSKFVVKLLTLLLLLGTVQAFASAIPGSSDLQQKRITGRVTDASGAALPGVNILEKGTINGAITDVDGKYALTVASSSALLNFSFIGYMTKEVPVGSQTTIDVVMSQAETKLDEIVVVGYSTQARKSLTGAVSTVNAASLSEVSTAAPMERLQGKVAGVTILNQHTPGEDATMRIRGMTTINDANPLYVVDGVPGGSYTPNDIESITILKDAAAQSIYGARAANGVVLITTKSGKKNQKVNITAEVRQGITRSSHFYNLLNTQEWGEMLWLQAKNFGLPIGDPTNPKNYTHSQYGNGASPVIPDYIYPAKTAEGSASVNPALYDNKLSYIDGTDTYLITKASKPGTDWFKEATRDAPYKEYSIDVSGGSANTTYALQLGYTDEEGIFKWTGFNRYNARLNVNSNPVKWLDVGTNLGVVFTKDFGYQGNDNSESSLVSWCYRLPPMVPVYDIAGNYAGSRPSGMGNAQNPVFLADKNQYDNTKSMTVSGNAHARITILKGLLVQSLIGVNQNNWFSRNIDYVEVAAAERGTYDSYGESAGISWNWTWTNTIEYSKLIGQHSFKVIGGSEAYDNRGSSISAGRTWYSNLDPNYMWLNTGIQAQSNSGSGISSYALFSLFGRLNYTYADKYMLEAVVRRDGSSRFGTQKYGIFPAASVGWRISQEDFMASTKSWLDELKLRAGYGVVGNDRMGNYNSFSQFGFSLNDACYPITGTNSSQGATGFRQSSFGNADVKWETTSTINIGIDATLLKHLSLSFDVWRRDTRDMLYPKQLPLVYGTASTPSVNIGQMKNTGFDLTLGYSNTAMNGDFSYSADLVVSHYKNELVKLTDNIGDFYSGSGFREKIYTRTQNGRAFPEFFGYISEGIFQTAEEAALWPKAFGSSGTYNQPGSFKYKDVDKNGYIDAADRVYIGSPHPKFTAGLSLAVAYKGVSLSTVLYSSYGNKIINYVSRFIDYTQFESGKSHRRLYESWGSPKLKNNADATMPMIASNDSQHQEPSTSFMEDGSYLRMRTLRLGYDLNQLPFIKDNFRTLQVYFQASNLFTLTKYTGLDPEIYNAGINMGIDSGAWPTPKQFMFGIVLGI
jgi:TonB-linked SusC/RagA family outer membrane protein